MPNRQDNQRAPAQQGNPRADRDITRRAEDMIRGGDDTTDERDTELDENDTDTDTDTEEDESR